MAFVYGLRASDATDYFYIGSTKHSLEHRLKQHLDYIRLGHNRNKHLVRKVQQVGAQNIVIEAIEECAETDQFDREFDHIRAFIERGVKLTNAVVSNRYQFELARQVQAYEEYELKPHHMITIVDAYEFGLKRGDNALANKFTDVVEKIAKHIFDKHCEEFLVQIGDVMAAHYEPEEANQQTTSLHQRVLALVERDRRSA